MQTMIVRRKLILGGLMAPLAGFAKEEDASSVLARAKQRYRGLKTYQDRGSVRYHLVDGDQEVRFETAFVRSSRFRFEWSKGHPFPPLRRFVTRNVIWSDGDAAYTWTKYPGQAATERKERSLATAVAGATGVSSRSAHVIATLLMADLWRQEPFGDSVLNLKGALRVGAESIDGVDCHRLRGMDWRGDPIELWLGKVDLMLRRSERILAGTKYIEERTAIVLDANIPASRFSAPSQTSV
jgi:hypothetical protein